MKKRKYGIIIVCVLLVIGAIFSINKIVKVNREYPQAKHIIHDKNEIIYKDTYQMVLEGVELYDCSVLLEERQITEYDTIDNGNEKIILVDLQLTNCSEEMQNINLTNFMLQIGTWSNGWDLELYCQINECEDVVVFLDEEQIEHVTLPFILCEFQFHDRDWRRIDNMEYQLAMSVYPEKEILRLN